MRVILPSFFHKIFGSLKYFTYLYNMENLDKITQTLGGYPIKDFRYNKRDNLFVGLVKDPICGRPELHDGYVVVVWRKNGKVEPRYGKGRTDLEIDTIILR